MEGVQTDIAAPVPFWCLLHGWTEAVHVVASVAVVAEQKLVVILTGATLSAGLALHALPWVFLNAHYHIVSEL